MSTTDPFFLRKIKNQENFWWKEGMIHDCQMLNGQIPNDEIYRKKSDSLYWTWLRWFQARVAVEEALSGKARYQKDSYLSSPLRQDT